MQGVKFGLPPGCHSIVLFLHSSTSKTLTFLHESRPFFRGHNSIWSFPRFLPLEITAFGGPEGYFSPAIIAFGPSEFIVPKFYNRLGQLNGQEESRLLNLRRLRTSRRSHFHDAMTLR